MPLSIRLLILGLAGGGLFLAAPDDTDVVFRSDVSLVRVDVQVLDSGSRAITGLTARDFVLREQGRPQEIRNFARENMPVDLLFLFDVSASMRPHVELIASASHRALGILGENDRVAIMVFDRAMRLRMPFRSSRSEVERGLEDMLDQESFHGGTDITRAMIAAAGYMELHARREARRAIVILTDDQTEFERNDRAVSRALVKADAVMSALIAPDAMAGRVYAPPRGGGLGVPLGGIILGRRPSRGVMRGPQTRSAGTSEIAQQSGGDSLPVDEASALETTLARIRQRYALHFLMPPDAGSGQERNIDVQLTDAARRRYPDAELRFRRTYLASTGSGGSPIPQPTEVAQSPASVDPVSPTPPPSTQTLKRRSAISEPDGPRGPNPSVGDVSVPPAPPAIPAAAPPAQPAPTETKPDPDNQQPQHGWRRVRPGEQP